MTLLQHRLPERPSCGFGLPSSAPSAQRSDTRGLKGNIAHLVMTLLIASLIEFSDAWGLRPDSKDISIYHEYWKHIISLKAHIHVFFSKTVCSLFCNNFLAFSSSLLNLLTFGIDLNGTHRVHSISNWANATALRCGWVCSVYAIKRNGKSQCNLHN